MDLTVTLWHQDVLIWTDWWAFKSVVFEVLKQKKITSGRFWGKIKPICKAPRGLNPVTILKKLDYWIFNISYDI